MKCPISHGKYHVQGECSILITMRSIGVMGRVVACYVIFPLVISRNALDMFAIVSMNSKGVYHWIECFDGLELDIVMHSLISREL